MRKAIAPLLYLSILTVLLPSTLLAAKEQIAPWQNPAYIQKAFNEIALKNEYKKTNMAVLKWKHPIRYQYIYHEMPKNPLVESVYEAHLEHLHQITGHPFHHLATNSKIKPNLTIHFTRDESYGRVIKEHTKSKVKNIERESNCMGSFSRNRKNEITSAVIIIPTDHVYSRGLLVACVVEETTQIMGLPNDSDWVNPSIANDASKIELLTGLDYLFLKILYDKRLSIGMPFKQNQEVIKTVVRELQRAGEIKAAARKVNQLGLYPLLN